MPPRPGPNDRNRRGGSGKPAGPGKPAGRPSSGGRPGAARRSDGPIAGRAGTPPRRSDGPARPGPARRGENPPARRSDGPPRPSSGRPGAGAPNRRPEGKRTERSATGRPSRPGAADGRPAREARPKDPRTSGWGGVAKKGVGKLKPTGGRGSASEDWRKAMRESDERERSRYGGKRLTEPEEWIDEGVVRDEARAAVERGTTKPVRKRPAKELPEDVRAEAARAAGPAWADRVQDRLRDAMRAYERERYQDARKLLVPLAQRAPGSLAVRELLGLTWYRLGRWKDAIKELEAVELLGGGTVEHHPVLMDCHRALKHRDDVERLWEELRQGGPAVDVMIEGRIVLAGALADRGEVREAIELLEQGPVGVRKPKDHHLRLWYALAAMYERAGDVPRARQLFGRVVEADPDFADVAERYDALT